MVAPRCTRQATTSAGGRCCWLTAPVPAPAAGSMEADSESESMDLEAEADDDGEEGSEVEEGLEDDDVEVAGKRKAGGKVGARGLELL